ncbi:MBL fold metallo-hydrolase [Micromonospora sp. NPDC000663]|uniref:MBL fold metallo-hydrolase n=1 Tax=Micromonospora sp. NPDC000663 TaxID=3364218 RepID=UPI0036ACC7BD
MNLVQLTSNLAFLRFPVGHVYLWHDDDGISVIDTSMPGSAPLIADAVHSLGRKLSDVRQVILTHGHEDHVGSAADITKWGDVTVMAHHADAAAVRGEQSTPPPVLSDWEQQLWDQVHADMPQQDVPPVHVDRELHDGDTLELAGEAVAMAVPGHTPGSLALYLPRQRVLFTGDTVARMPDGSVILGVFNANPAEAFASLQKQAALKVDIACFGHGEPVTKDASRMLKAAAEQLLP